MSENIRCPVQPEITLIYLFNKTFFKNVNSFTTLLRINVSFIGTFQRTISLDKELVSQNYFVIFPSSNNKGSLFSGYGIRPGEKVTAPIFIYKKIKKKQIK